MIDNREADYDDVSRDEQRFQDRRYQVKTGKRSMLVIEGHFIFMTRTRGDAAKVATLRELLRIEDGQ